MVVLPHGCGGKIPIRVTRAFFEPPELKPPEVIVDAICYLALRIA